MAITTGVLPRLERRHHLAGALGAAFAERLFTLGWIEGARKGRAVYLTDPGTSGLRERFGIEPGSESG